MARKSLVLLVLSFIFPITIQAQFNPGVVPNSPYRPQATPKKTKGEILVKVTRRSYRKYSSTLQRRMGRKPSKSQVYKSIARSFGLRKLSFLSKNRFVVKGRRVREAKLRKAVRRFGVRGVEENYKLFAFNKPDDTFFALDLMWSLNNTGVLGTQGVDIEMQEGWNITQGSNDVIVAVIDTGVLASHPDLVDNIWRNPRETLNGLDDDNNGFVDDVAGWDFYNNDNDARDDNFHGTHCAGIIAATGHNKRGIIGVAPNVKILPLKVLSARGEGETSNLIAAIEYVNKLKRSGVNIRVMNASLGGGGKTEAVQVALRKANRNGVLFVAAAGNSSADNDAEPIYPASYKIPNVISVAALDSDGNLASYSNYGKQNVHVAAPGSNIWSTILFNLYFPFSGTSMAAPHVAGIAALVQSRNRGMSPEAVKRKITSSVRPLAALNGLVAYPGIVSAKGALR